MPKNELRADVQVGAHGRLVIPALLRRALNLKPGAYSDEDDRRFRLIVTAHSGRR